MPNARRTQEKDWAQDFLDALASELTVSNACKKVGIGRTTAYERRQRDEEFALAWADVEEATTERMEREAFRRAVQGVESDVFHQGQVIGTETKFSDTLLIFMLKSRRPEKYRENVKVEHGGTVGVDLRDKTDGELDELLGGLADRMR